MSHGTENIMDELPELQSDADVDALMARLRARVVPPPAPAAEPAQPSTRPASTDDAVRDLVAAQDTFAASVVRAMQMMVEALEDLEPTVDDTSAPRRERRGRKQRAAEPRRRPGRRAR